MPPPKPKKMTAQPVRTRHFVGKPAVADPEQPSSSEDSESESEQEQKRKQIAKPKPAPVASSFPKAALKSNLAARQKSEAERRKLEEEFETESESEAGSEDEGSESGSGSGSDEDSSEEEESSEEEAPRKLLRPVFLKKNQRNQSGTPVKSAEEIAAEEERRKQEETRTLVEDQVRQRQEERLAKQRAWDDDDAVEADLNAINDTDGVDPEAEYAAWKLRELKRIRREREKIEEAERALAEIERRRNLSAAEREAEDREFIAQQQEERGDRGQMNFMQKYFHKGAFFQDDLKELGVDRRNVMNARFEDATNREVLPEYMQIRDMTKLGKKGRTRYRDMKSEDTGQWGNFDDRRKPRDDYGVDERFRADRDGGRDEWRDREGATGANAKPLGERKRFGEEPERDGKRARVDDP